MSTSFNPSHTLEQIQDQFGHKIAARLSEGAAQVPHDISERLRVARAQALGKRKKTQTVLVTRSATSQQGDTLTLGGNESIGPWARLAAILPLIALVIGLVMINMTENDSRARELAEVDSALLTDDLPPSAYVDPGFLQFLKTSHDVSNAEARP